MVSVGRGSVADVDSSFDRLVYAAADDNQRGARLVAEWKRSNALADDLRAWEESGIDVVAW